MADVSSIPAKRGIEAKQCNHTMLYCNSKTCCSSRSFSKDSTRLDWCDSQTVGANGGSLSDCSLVLLYEVLNCSYSSPQAHLNKSQCCLFSRFLFYSLVCSFLLLAIAIVYSCINVLLLYIKFDCFRILHSVEIAFSSSFFYMCTCASAFLLTCKFIFIWCWYQLAVWLH